MDLGAPEILIILVIVLVLFGSTKIPKLARSLGEASKEFRKGIEEGNAADPAAAAPAAPAASASAPVPPPVQHTVHDAAPDTPA